MTLSEINNGLPNGFHDAVLHRCEVHYGARTVTMEVSLWVGTMDHPAGPERERYASATLTISGFFYLVIDPPANDTSPEQNESTIDGNPVTADEVKAASLPDTPADCFAYQFYVFAWNGFIHVAARSATLTFAHPDDEAYVRRLMNP